MTQKCSHADHGTIDAAYQLTMYDRHTPPAEPSAKWRGFCCPDCVDQAREFLKRAPGQSILLIWTIKP